MPNYNAVRINDFDTAAISNEVNKWQSHGKMADYDLSRRELGVASFFLDYSGFGYPPFFNFRVFKLQTSGFVFKKTIWIIQLAGSDSWVGPYIDIGCVQGRTLAFAIHGAQKAISSGARSLPRFDVLVSQL